MNANFICFVSPILDKCVQQLEQLSSSFQLSMVQQTSATGALAILVILVQMEPELPLESLLGTIIINISCIGTEDLKAGKYTCRSEGACAATAPKNPPPTNAIANWSNCRSGIDSCANGSNGSAFSCCVAPEDVKSGKSTCRAQGHCASTAPPITTTPSSGSHFCEKEINEKRATFRGITNQLKWNEGFANRAQGSAARWNQVGGHSDIGRGEGGFINGQIMTGGIPNCAQAATAWVEHEFGSQRGQCDESARGGHCRIVLDAKFNQMGCNSSGKNFICNFGK